MATKNAIQKKEQAVAVVPEAAFSEDQIKLITNTVAQGATPNELQLFLHQCQRTGLDPLSRQIHFVKRGDKATIQTGIDGLRLIADRTGRYAPGEPPEFRTDPKGSIISARIFIHKKVDGEWFKVWGEAFFSEYAQKTNNGQLTHMWRDKPHIMLGKCAEAVALRRGFPAELSGIYTHDEMAQADNAPTQMHEQHSKSEAKVHEPEVIQPKAQPKQRNGKPAQQEPAAEDPVSSCRKGLVFMGVPEDQLDVAFDSFAQQANGDITQLLSWLRQWAAEGYRWDSEKGVLVPAAKEAV